MPEIKVSMKLQIAPNNPSPYVRISSQSSLTMLYRFSSNVPFLELDCPFSGAIDIGILHSLYNQAPKKVILYEKQYS
jgi:hypothetical protein